MCDVIIDCVYRKIFLELEKCCINLQACLKQSYIVGEKKLPSQFFHNYARNKQHVAMFHASLTEETKAAIYSECSRSTSSIQCLVATVAFGMVRQC